MNCKKLVCFTVLAVVSTNVGAMQIYKGKIVSQKITTTDGSQGAVAPNKKTIVFPTMQQRSFSDKLTSVLLDSSVAKMNEPVELSTNHYTFISNASDVTELYEVVHTVCSQTSEASTHCIFYHKQIELEAGGYFSDDTRPVLTMKFSQPGRYHTTAITSVFNTQNADTMMTPTVSEAGAAVDVT